MSGRYKNITLLFATFFLMACAQLPQAVDRTPSLYIKNTATTTDLGRAIAPLQARHENQSGIYPLTEGLDAYFARLALIDVAEKSLDVQYYIWHNDDTGRLLLYSLLKAADRGIRVRILLDDINSAGIEAQLQMADRHPNIEVHLFNPFAARDFRGMDFLTRFSEVNRRMHNKSLTADNQASIIGGRNIGDEYFQARPDLEFGDLDVIAIGLVVDEVSRAFDLYYNSETVIPISAFDNNTATDADLEILRESLEKFSLEMESSQYAARLRKTEIAKQLIEGELAYSWGQAHIIYDHPDKALGKSAEETDYLLNLLAPVLKGVEHELLLISPYFIPGDEGVDFLGSLVKRGVRVRILTNSLAANDVSIVHSGYSRYRMAMLEAGIELFELKPGAKPKKREHSSLGSSSRASLHAKSFVFDRKQIFVGSLNLDPRSIEINTEIGLVIEVPQLAAKFGQWFDTEMPVQAWHLQRVKLPANEDEDRDFDEYVIHWLEQKGDEQIIYDSEPQVSAWKLFTVWFYSLLPVESQL